ncbi:MAG: VCBS repeat-containing protein, partial [Verrucomicrobiota bacterium]
LLWRDDTTGQNVIWLMLANTVVRKQPILTGDTNYYVVGTGDFNGDGYDDILWRHKSVDLTYVWYLNGTNFMAAAQVPYFPGLGWYASATGDFNNDGYTDIVWRETAPLGRIAIWYMNNVTLLGGFFATQSVASQGWQIAGAGPFNRLGNCDLVWRYSDGSDALWLMISNNLSYTASLPSVPSSSSIGCVGGYRTPTMLLTAIPDAVAGSVTLKWNRGWASLPAVERRLPGATAWTTLANGVLPYSFTNTGLTIGQRYEYRVNQDDANYVSSGIKASPIENRGKVILIMDKTITNSAFAELDLLRTNLAGDGWTVIRTNVPRHDDLTWANNPPVIASIKSFITNTYNADPNNTKAVFLVGHVPIPYSGFFAPDGHVIDPGCHKGAWPADGYYGDVDGLWTDSTNFTNVASGPGACNPDPRQWNSAGDGKFDCNVWPANSSGVARLELIVGRVDFANMPAFSSNLPPGVPPKSETDLLKQYINKNHRYRQKQLNLNERLIVQAALDPAVLGSEIERTYGTALRNGNRFFGIEPGKVFQGDLFVPTNSSSLWGVAVGYGGYSTINLPLNFAPPHSTSDLADPAKEPPIGFYLLGGSYFGDWNTSDNLMRACLATSNYGLTCAFCYQVDWAFEKMAMDEPIGSGFLRTIELSPASASRTHLAILGDPTLRLKIIAPASNLRSSGVQTNVNLNWNASPEPGAQYLVYRSVGGLKGTWTRLTPNPISATSFTDNPAPPQLKVYRIRAASLSVTGSGSFTNLSQGIFLNVN